MWVINLRHYEVEGKPLIAYEVGYYIPAAAITPKWVAIMEYDTVHGAIGMVHFLNGGAED